MFDNFCSICAKFVIPGQSVSRHANIPGQEENRANAGTENSAETKESPAGWLADRLADLT